MNKKSRKEVIKNLLLRKAVGGYGRIYQLVETGKLDKIILKIDDRKTETLVSSITPKGYLTGNEQFLDVLSNFISLFDRFFPMVSYRDYLLECIFDNDEIPEFLLCKKYWGDNDNIPYFTFQMKRYIVFNFSKTLKEINNGLNIEIRKYFDNKVSIDIDNENDIDWLFEKIHNLCWTNVNCYSVIHLFGNWGKSFKSMTKMMKKNGKTMLDAANVVNENYIMHLDILCDNYFKNKKILSFVKNM